MTTTSADRAAGRIRMSTAVEAKLRAHHLHENKVSESFSYALGHAYCDSAGRLTIVLADPDAVLMFATDCFVSSGFGHVVLDKKIKAHVFLRAIERGYTAVVDVHDHHFAKEAIFSGTDDADDLANARYVRETVQAYVVADGKRLFAAALLLSHGDWAARHVTDAGFVALHVDRVGANFARLSALGRGRRKANPLHARHAGLISVKQQQTLVSARAVVVGGGGTGSIAVEGLARLGFTSISIIDADQVEASNLNRLQGAGPVDVGRPKVTVLADRLRQIAPMVHVEAIQADCFGALARESLESADLIVCCVDNVETRWWLNCFAAQYMIPFFDCAVAVFRKPAIRHEVRVSTVLPRVTACGHCASPEFLPRQTPARFLDRETLRVQRLAGYISDAPDEVAPSVYLVNQLAVSFVLQEVMNWFCGWRPVASSVYYRSDQARIERIDPNVMQMAPVPGCPVCDAPSGLCREGMLPSSDVEVDLRAAAQRLTSSVGPALFGSGVSGQPEPKESPSTQP